MAKRSAAKRTAPVKRSRKPVKSKPVARKRAAGKVKPRAKKAPKAKKVTAAARATKPSRKVVKKRSAPKRRATTTAVVAKRAAASKGGGRKPAGKAAPKTTGRVKTAKAAKPATTPTAKLPPPKKAATGSGPASPRKLPALDRERRTVDDSAPSPSLPSSLAPKRRASAASSGADEMRAKRAHYTSAGPELTAGDVDASWESAESAGEGAPGGENPTPDQNEVDGIGEALGVQYDDGEELRGGDEIADRDHDRWELDPASSDDFDER